MAKSIVASARFFAQNDESCAVTWNFFSTDLRRRARHLGTAATRHREPLPQPARRNLVLFQYLFLMQH